MPGRSMQVMSTCGARAAMFEHDDMTQRRWFCWGWVLAVAGCVVTGCERPVSTPNEDAEDGVVVTSTVAEADREGVTSGIVAAARGRIGRTVVYDGAYVGLAYPGGDVPIERGVCSDVVIRALRDGLDMDLQRLVHEDMSAAFGEYPTIWGLSKPDRNIDHRRVPNLRRYFERRGWSLGVSDRLGEYRAGDLVTCKVGGNRPHIMVVSDRKNSAGVPLVIHNIGRGTKEENRLFEFALTGHYRIEGGAGSDDGVGGE